MDDNLTNLLPASHVRSLRREYFLRLATVAGVLALGVLTAHAALLFPTYLYGQANAAAKQAELDTLRMSQATAQEREIAERLGQLRRDVEHLERLGRIPTGSSLVRSLLDVPRPDTLLTGIKLTRAEGETPGSMTVSGRARSRDSLRAYVAALEAAPGVASAELPISAYAKERDIPFIITLRLAAPSL
jgi:Tfp pilus assembly protein PilN